MLFIDCIRPAQKQDEEKGKKGKVYILTLKGGKEKFTVVKKE